MCATFTSSPAINLMVASVWLILSVSASFAIFEPCKSHAMHREVGNRGWPISSLWVGQTVTPKGIFRPIATAQEDSHIYSIWTWSENVTIYIYRQGWVGEKKNAMLLKESQKEMNRLKSHCSARKQYLCTPYGTLSPASLCHGHGHAWAPKPCLQSILS